MNTNNVSRLWEQARKRREANTVHVANTNPIYPEPCCQCNGPAITKFTDMVTGTTTYWCETDWEHWWAICTFLPQLRDGSIRDVEELFVRPVTTEFDDLESQLLGWPD